MGFSWEWDGWKGLRWNALSLCCWFVCRYVGGNHLRPSTLQKTSFWKPMIVHIIVLVGFSSEQVWVDGSKVKCLEPLLLVCLQISWGGNHLRPSILQNRLLEAYDCPYVLVGFCLERMWVEGSKVKCLEPLLLVCLQISWGNHFRPSIL